MEAASARTNRIPEVRLDRSGAVLELNQSAAEILAVTPAEILAKPASLLGDPWGGYLRTPQTGPLRWRRLADGNWSVQLLLPPTAEQLADLREAMLLSTGEEARDLLVQAVAGLLHNSPGGLWAHDSGLLAALAASGGVPNTPMAALDVWAVRLGRPLVHRGPLALAPLPNWRSEEDAESVPLYQGAFLIGLLLGPIGLWTSGEGARVAADARRLLSQNSIDKNSV